MEEGQELSLELREPSTLYRLPPEGIGTGLCEGLVGYITRLSQAHHLLSGTLIKHVLALEIGKDYVLNDVERGASRFYQRCRTLNGVGNFSREIVDVVQKLTSLDSLDQLTLLPWKHVIVDKYLLKDSKAWCPGCFHDWKKQNKTIYEPLVWSLKDFTICPIHAQPLSVICPNYECNKSIAVLGRNSYIGYCPSCLIWLGGHTKPIPDVEDWEKQLWFSSSLLSLVSKSPEIIDIGFEAKALQKCFARLLNRSASRSPTLAKTLCLPRENVWQYCTGKYSPPLHTILTICFHLKISPLNFLTNQDFTLTLENASTIQYSNKLQHKKVSYDHLEDELLTMLQITPPLSLNEIARRVGYSTKTLKNHSPTLTTEIKNSYKKFRATLHEQNNVTTHSDIKKTVYLLVDQGIYPSNKAVEKHLKRPGMLKRPEYRQTWKQTKNEFYRQ